MARYECGVHSAGVEVDFVSDHDLLPYLTTPEASLDHLELRVSKKLLKSPFRVYYHDHHSRQLIYFEHEAHIFYPWNMMCNGQTVIFASYPFFEVQRQAQGYVTAHSAAVEVNGKSVLLLGKIGAGKSSIAIDLCQRYQGLLIGNDLTIVGLEDEGITLKGGTKFFFLRYESMRRNLPELLRFFPDDPEDTWTCKVKILPAQLGTGIKQGNSLVDQIYLVHVDENAKSLVVRKDNSLVTKLFLNENFTRYIRATCLTMLGGEQLDMIGFIPCFDKLEFYHLRKQLIEAVLSKIYYIAGPLHLVTDYIVNDKNGL